MAVTQYKCHHCEFYTLEVGQNFCSKENDKFMTDKAKFCGDYKPYKYVTKDYPKGKAVVSTDFIYFFSK